MSLHLCRIPYTRERAIRSLATSVITPYGRSGPYRRIHTTIHSKQSSLISDHFLRPFSPLSSTLPPRHLTSQPSPVLIVSHRLFSSFSTLYQEQRKNEDVKDTPRQGDPFAKEASEESAKSDKSSDGEGQESSGDKDKNKKGKEEEKEQGPPPPPPPHGDKSPWQVFTQTLQSEFQASKEWRESTKALASSAHQFTENESVKKARAAYTAASGAASSTTSSALKSTGKVLGQGAAWTWDTPVVKGVRAGVNLTGKGIDRATKPVRETAVYKKAVGSVKDVIDDGSSSKYGGWVEKEERRKQRELRELNQSRQGGRPGKPIEKMDEDPK